MNRPTRITFFGFAICLMAALFYACAARAQIVDKPSDSELAAAYCIGALTVMSPKSPEIHRLRAYLAAKGIASRVAIVGNGANIAVNRGWAEAIYCKEPGRSGSEACARVSRCATPLTGLPF